MKDNCLFISGYSMVNRVYDMLCYLGDIKGEIGIKKILEKKLSDSYYVEKLINYFERVFNRCGNNYDLRRDLCYLIDDLRYLKQYLDCH